MRNRPGAECEHRARKNGVTLEGTECAEFGTPGGREQRWGCVGMRRNGKETENEELGIGLADRLSHTVKGQ